MFKQNFYHYKYMNNEKNDDDKILIFKKKIKKITLYYNSQLFCEFELLDLNINDKILTIKYFNHDYLFIRQKYSNIKMKNKLMTKTLKSKYIN